MGQEPLLVGFSWALVIGTHVLARGQLPMANRVGNS
jgi:hypothetical protein